MDCVYLFDRYFGFRCLAVLDLPGAVFFVHGGEQQRVRGRGIGLGRCSGDAF